jgi:hypothetical protein
MGPMMQPKRNNQAANVRRAATSLHEKLCRPDVQDRISNVHEILREEVVKMRFPPALKPP